MLRLLDTNAAWLRDLHVMRPQRDFVREDGRLVADFVGRFENLAADFARVCARLGLTTLLPRKNVSHHGAYAGYYDAWGRDFIARRYAGDIDEFGYTFEALS
jgi:hypothetical protein